MEIEALQLIAGVGLFEQPVGPVRPIGEVVHTTVITQEQDIDQWIEETNRRYLEELGRQLREERRPVNPETHQ